MNIKVLVFSDCGNALFLELAADGRRYTEYRSTRDVPREIQKAASSCEIIAPVQANGYDLGTTVYEGCGNAVVTATGNMVQVVADSVADADMVFKIHMGGVSQWLEEYGGLQPLEIGFEIRAYGDDPEQYPLQEGSQRYTVFTATTVVKDLKAPQYFQFRSTSNPFGNYALGISIIQADEGPVEFINSGHCVIVSGQSFDDAGKVWQDLLQLAQDSSHKR